MHRLPAQTVEGATAAGGAPGTADGASPGLHGSFGEIEAMLLSSGVETVIVAGLDTNGTLRGKRVPARDIAGVLEHGLAMCEVIWALPADEAQPVPAPAGHAGYFPRDGYPDMLLRPDAGTVRVLPWQERTAIALGDFHDLGGRPNPLCPRGALRSVVRRAERMGFEPVVGVELEFYVLCETPSSVRAKRPSQLQPVDERLNVYGVLASARQEPLLRAVRESLFACGVPVEACNPEAGPGQFEVNLRRRPALHAADDAVLLRYAVKEQAADRGLLATFMAKPRSDWPGSSCHFHVSLRRAGADAFHDPDAPDGMSETMRSYTAGALAAMAELTAIMAPNPNSYRRFGAYSWAGSSATWALDNRTAGLRAVCHGSDATRLEHRQAGADANPYLALAAVLAAGLHGMEHGLAPPPADSGDLYRRDDLDDLPRSLDAAADRLAASELARDWLGADLVAQHVAMCRAEAAAAAAAVTDWETARYLEVL
jgi:glutamine synthetase